MTRKRLPENVFQETIKGMRLSAKSRSIAEQILVQGSKARDIAKTHHITPQAVSHIVNSVWQKFLNLQQPPEGWVTFCASLPPEQAQQVLDHEKRLRANAEKSLCAVELLDDQMANMKRLFEDMPGYIYWKNTESIYMGCNKNLARISGLKDPNEIIGKTDFDFNWGRKEGEQFRVDDQEIMQTGKTLITEYQLPVKRSDGNYIWIRTEKMRYRDKNGNIAGIIGVAVDVTDEKLFENQLKEAKEIAEEANRAKSEFLANMSHDLKTPLTGIIGSAQILQQMPIPQEAREFVEGVYNSGNILLQNIDYLLDYSKEESGKIELKPETFDLRELIEKTISSLIPNANEKKLDLIISYPESNPRFIIGDAHYVRRILLNLVSNAIKFTSKGYIMVSIDSVSQEKNKALIKMEITDTGMGIPEDKQSVIFDRFTTLTPSYRGMYKGLGLGLNIVKRAVEKMNGTVEVKSVLGKGSTFICEFIFSIEKIFLKTSDWQTHYKKISILVVDDLDVRGKVLANTIGTTVDVSSSQEALAILKEVHTNKKPYQIVIIDDQLKYTDALTLSETIKNDARFARTLVILLSLPKSAAEMNEAKEAGIFKVFVKPFMPSEVHGKLFQAWNQWLEASISIEDRLKEYEPKIMVIESNEMDKEILKVILMKLGAKTECYNQTALKLDNIETNQYDMILISLDPDINLVTRLIDKIREREDKSNPLVIVGLVNTNTIYDEKRLFQTGINRTIRKPIDPELLKRILSEELFSAS